MGERGLEVSKQGKSPPEIEESGLWVTTLFTKTRHPLTQADIEQANHLSSTQNPKRAVPKLPDDT